MGDFQQMKSDTFFSLALFYGMKHLFSFLALSFSHQTYQFNIIS